jgi:hypothetical protein
MPVMPYRGGVPKNGALGVIDRTWAFVLDAAANRKWDLFTNWIKSVFQGRF